MDKFLYLVRQMLNAGFTYLKQNQWRDEKVRESYLGILEEVPLSARDAKVPNGLRYHVLDIYVDELDEVDEKRDVPLEEMLRPLRKLAKEGMTKSVRARAAEALEDERVGDWKGENVKENNEDEEEMGEGEDSEDDENAEFGGFDD